MQLLDNLYLYNMGSHTIPVSSGEGEGGRGGDANFSDRYAPREATRRRFGRDGGREGADGDGEGDGLAWRALPAASTSFEDHIGEEEEEAWSEDSYESAMAALRRRRMKKDVFERPGARDRERGGGSSPAGKKREPGVDHGRRGGAGGRKGAGAVGLVFRWAWVTGRHLVEDVLVCSDYIVSSCVDGTAAVVTQAVAAISASKESLFPHLSLSLSLSLISHHLEASISEKNIDFFHCF